MTLSCWSWTSRRPASTRTWPCGSAPAWPPSARSGARPCWSPATTWSRWSGSPSGSCSCPPAGWSPTARRSRSPPGSGATTWRRSSSTWPPSARPASTPRGCGHDRPGVGGGRGPGPGPGIAGACPLAAGPGGGPAPRLCAVPQPAPAVRRDRVADRGHGAVRLPGGVLRPPGRSRLARPGRGRLPAVRDRALARRLPGADRRLDRLHGGDLVAQPAQPDGDAAPGAGAGRRDRPVRAGQAGHGRRRGRPGRVRALRLRRHQPRAGSAAGDRHPAAERVGDRPGGGRPHAALRQRGRGPRLGPHVRDHAAGRRLLPDRGPPRDRQAHLGPAADDPRLRRRPRADRRRPRPLGRAHPGRRRHPGLRRRPRLCRLDAAPVPPPRVRHPLQLSRSPQPVERRPNRRRKKPAMAWNSAVSRPLTTVPTRLPASSASTGRGAGAWGDRGVTAGGVVAEGAAAAPSPAVVVPSPAAPAPDGGPASAEEEGEGPVPGGPACGAAGAGAGAAEGPALVAPAVVPPVAAVAPSSSAEPAGAGCDSRVARRQSANWPKRRVATSLMAPPRPKEATLPVSWTSMVTWRRVWLSPTASSWVSTLARAVPAPLVSLPVAARRALWLASSTPSTTTLPLSDMRRGPSLTATVPS